VPTSYLPIPRTSGPNGEGPDTLTADMLGRYNELREWNLDLDRLADFVMYRSGTIYRASSSVGVFSGTDPGTVMQAVLDALGPRAGTGLLAGSEDFAWGSTIPKVPAGITGKLTLRSLGGHKVVLSPTAPRFIDLATVGAGATFQNIELDGIVVDAAPVAAETTTQHLLFGNYRGGAGAQSQINFDNITIRNCKVLGAKVDGSGAHYPIYFITQQTASGQPNNFITRILVENNHLDGGMQGTVALGFKYLTWTGEPDIWINDVVIRDWWQTLRTPPTAFAASSHIHIGSRAQVGRVLIENAHGYGSRDVGIEVNNFHDVTINNSSMEDCFGHYYYSTNFRPPRRLAEQGYRLNDSTARCRAGGHDPNASSFWRFTGKNAGGKMGAFFVNNFKGYSSEPSPVKLQRRAASMAGEARKVVVDGFEHVHEGLNHTAVTDENYYPIVNETEGKTPVTLKKVSVRVSGRRDATAGALNVWAIQHPSTSNVVVNYDDIEATVEVAGVSDFGLRMLSFEGAMKGTIRRFRVGGVGAAVGYRGILIGGGAIEDELRIEDSDFSGARSGTSGADVLFGSSGLNKPNVVFVGNKWSTFPPAPRSIVVGASPFLYRNLSGFQERIIISGGTVSAVEFSRDNVNFVNLGETAGSFILDNADYLRVTHTAAPTMTAIPAKV
jgi:hypothetical protein